MNEEVKFLSSCTLDFCALLRSKKVKEVQIKMLQHYVKQYLKNRFEEKYDDEETLGDVLEINKDDFELLKEEISELLDVINVYFEIKGKEQSGKEIFLKILENYKKKFLTDLEI